MPLKLWRELPDVPPPLLTAEAWEKLEGRPERIRDVLTFFPDGRIPAWPRRVQDFYDEFVGMILTQAMSGEAPTLRVVAWIRGRVYQALSMCQTGPDIIDSCAAAVQRAAHRLEAGTFWKVMTALTTAEPHTSYRTPLSLEAGMLTLYETVRTAQGKPTVLADGGGIRKEAALGEHTGSPGTAASNTLTAATTATTATTTATATAAAVATLVKSRAKPRAKPSKA